MSIVRHDEKEIGPLTAVKGLDGQKMTNMHPNEGTGRVRKRNVFIAVLFIVGFCFFVCLALPQLWKSNTPAPVTTGGLLAFHADVNRDSIWEIYIMRADGTGFSRLTDGNKNLFSSSFPKWSPDAKQLLFTKSHLTKGSSEIFIMDADGSNQRKVSGIFPFSSFAVWSPDGTQIAFLSSNENKFHIYLTDPNGAPPKLLTPDNMAVDSEPAWSPDSKRIAFLSQLGNGRPEWGIFVIDAVGGPPAPIVVFKQFTEFNTSLEWSPDGKQLAFSAVENRVFNVYTYDLGTNKLTKVAGGLSPTWSPDSKLIAYSYGDGRIYVVNADGSGSPIPVGPVSSVDFYGGAPAWSRVTPLLALPVQTLPTFTAAPTPTHQ